MILKMKQLNINKEIYNLWLTGRFTIDEVISLRDEYLEIFHERFTKNGMIFPEPCEQLLRTYDKIISENDKCNIR